MRPIEPTASGFAVNPNDGARLFYEVFGPPDAARTIVFPPPWNIIHSRVWKMQVPYFAQHGFRVVVYDPRGNGRSDRPATGYGGDSFYDDMLAVCDATGVERATFVGLSAGAHPAIRLAVEQPHRVSHLILIGPSVRFGEHTTAVSLEAFLAEPPDREGWNKWNAVHWREDYPDFLEWFIRLSRIEPHSSKGIEDGIAWGLETTPEVLIADMLEGYTPRTAELATRVACPTLIVHGAEDQVVKLDDARKLHSAIQHSRLMVVEGAGHNPASRHPVKVNELIHDFLGRELPRTSTWHWALARPKRALFVSSPIGLGHVQRDLAVARELRRLVPGLEIEWLAQHPVTRVLEENGECIHPLSARLASESRHVESEMTGEHELPVFDTYRSMDEILLANFFVFLEAARRTPYDLWIGDEAWELDHFLHETPELKTAPYAWLTDVVGFLPADRETATEREVFLTADYNAELVEHVARFPSVRDVSIFIGSPDDAPPDSFGPGLPSIRDWTAANHDCVGYIRYFDPEALGDRAALRARFGFGTDERVAVAAVGGTSVGSGLLRRIIDAWPLVRDLVPDLRLVVVSGPRIDPAGLFQLPGVDYRGYVHNLYEQFAAADLALVQGGLSTTMELVALKKPFLYFPLKDHFEQQRYVAHRLERYGVPEWVRLQLDRADAASIAEAARQVLDTPVSYRDVEGGGARQTAERIASLLR